MQIEREEISRVLVGLVGACLHSSAHVQCARKIGIQGRVGVRGVVSGVVGVLGVAGSAVEEVVLISLVSVDDCACGRQIWGRTGGRWYGG